MKKYIIVLIPIICVAHTLHAGQSSTKQQTAKKSAYLKHRKKNEPTKQESYLDSRGSNKWKVTNNSSYAVTFRNADGQEFTVGQSQSVDVPRGNSFYFTFSMTGGRRARGKTNAHFIYIDTEVQGSPTYTTAK